MEKKKHKILFLASWYPNRLNPIHGSFINKHAKAVSKFCNVAVLNITFDPNLKGKTYDVDIKKDDEILTVTIYHNIEESPKSIIRRLINLLNILKIEYKGIKIIFKQFGKPDLIHVNVIWPMGILAPIVKFFSGIPYIVTEHWTGYLPIVGKYRGKLKKLITPLVIKNAYAITTVSNSLGQVMKKHGLKNNYFIVPNVIEPNFFNLNKINNHSRKIILHVSRLNDTHKNISGIIKATLNILKNRNDFELRIIGNGPDRDFLEGLTKKFKLENNIKFFGVLKDSQLQKNFSEADFFVLNSNYETFSVVTAEALASGMPVIATICGGPEEFVTDDVGILIQPNNPKQLEEAMVFMLDNYNSYDKKKLQEYAFSNFSYEKVGKKFLEIYNKCLGKKKN